MLHSGEKKRNILTLVLSEKKNSERNKKPPPASPLEQYFLKISLLEKTENTNDTMYQRYK